MYHASISVFDSYPEMFRSFILIFTGIWNRFLKVEWKPSLAFLYLPPDFGTITTFPVEKLLT